jgi:hypothetical protein
MAVKGIFHVNVVVTDHGRSISFDRDVLDPPTLAFATARSRSYPHPWS